MKIGILTQALSNNYGGLLQNYALQTVLKNRGYDVCTLDWTWIKRKSIKTYVRQIINVFLKRNRSKVYIPTPTEEAVIHQNVYHFKDTYITHTGKFKSHRDFVDYDKKERVEAYIVGSDQCWRPKYNPFQGEMFLDFVSNRNVKRIAYAASFGTDEWEFKDIKYAKYAKLFKLVTVREKSGVNLCKDHLGVEAYDVFDPTLLIDRTDYERLIAKEESGNSEGELFYYILDPNPKIKEIINIVGHKLKMNPFMILPKYKEEYRTKENVKDHINDCIYPSPTKWLKGIMDSKLTIVDSFHGMVFSIIFNKPFWVIGNVKRGMTRFTSLLEQLNLEDRLITVEDLEKVDLLQPIDWIKVNALKDKKKNESLALLFNALENE